MDMSINCVYIGKDEIYLAADSRETFVDNSFRDDRQKIFFNGKYQLIWSVTGVLKYNNIDYVEVVNSIMNQEKATVEEKLIAIQHIMQYPTQALQKEFQKDEYFTMFVGTIINNNLTAYTLEVRNGVISENKNRRYTEQGTYYFSGDSKEFDKYLNKKTFEKYDTPETKQEMIHEITDAVFQVQKINTTIGGNTHIITLDKTGKIKHFIKGNKNYK